MAGRTRVVVYDVKIASLFDQGENAVEFVKDVIDSIIAYAENFTVPRGGPTSGRIRQGWPSLRSRHKSTGVLRRGAFGAGGGAYNDAPHAEWVHNGVAGRIYPTRGRYLAVPVAPGTVVARVNPVYGAAGGRMNRAGQMVPAKRGVLLVSSVRGQDANPWLARAGDKVVAEYRGKAYYRNWAKGGTRLTGG